MCLICNVIDMIKRGENPYFVRELETGYVVIGNHQYFPGYSLFLCKEHTTELFYLEESFRDKFMREMSMVAEAVMMAFGADKMNYELLGNEDSHVHWHLYPRRKGDLDGYSYNGKGGPVWYEPWSVMGDEKYVVIGDRLEEMNTALSNALDKVLSKNA